MLREVKMIIRRAADIEVQELQSNDDPTSIINWLTNGFTYGMTNLDLSNFLSNPICHSIVKRVHDNSLTWSIK